MQKNAMHCMIESSDVHLFTSKLKQRRLYRKKRFQVSNKKKIFQRNSIRADDNVYKKTQIEEIQDDLAPYPTHYFVFTTFEQLDSKICHDAILTGLTILPFF